MVKLSVILVNYNVKYFLEQALLSVRKASANLSVEVFVVDNNSVDGSVAMVAEKFPEVKLIANTVNTGFSRANNQAMLLAQGQYVLLLNPDTIVQEDTFEKVTAFMDQHPEAGGLGVKMIDGSGRFLPESKRGLPSPAVAFYKIFGLSALFPRSRTFGRYHLGFLDRNQVHEVEILSGAFMLLRKEALDKTGLLDESFFMYGEDIDLSYRIIKAGYKNYYFPETSIIHYKGESTRKSSINYVFVFYNAMIIFARKHFSEKNASLFSFLINVAIYLRASLAILSRFFRRISVPALDFAVLYAGIGLIKELWEQNVKSPEGVYYPERFMQVVIPAYVLAWLTSVYLSGGYDKPVKLYKIVRGILTGAVLILVAYALLPESYRYSRAIILLSTLWAALSMCGIRLLLSLAGHKSFVLDGSSSKRLVIAGEVEEGERVLSLLRMSQAMVSFAGFVSPARVEGGKAASYLGDLSRLKEIVEVYRIDEVIFCAKDIPAQTIIENMSVLADDSLEYKIAPPESLYIIGSNSIHSNGELYVIDINSIARPGNRRNKRIMDIGLSLCFLVAAPLLAVRVKNRKGFAGNIFRVLAGRSTWVGYASGSPRKGPDTLPKIRPGIISPLHAHSTPPDETSVDRLNSLYAKDYNVYNDLYIIWKGFRELGSRKQNAV
jgi:O-antigen biosynthesis protein